MYFSPYPDEGILWFFSVTAATFRDSKLKRAHDSFRTPFCFNRTIINVQLDFGFQIWFLVVIFGFHGSVHHVDCSK